jgi:broad specificity phosphatase PhoE
MNYDKKFRVILLRHGETVYNIEKRLQSSKDRLTDKGRSQIENLKPEILRFNLDKILASDERRAIESAEIISSWFKMDFEVESLIREKSSGSFSDRLVADVDWSLVRGTFFDKKIPGGESINEVVERAKIFFKKISEF